MFMGRSEESELSGIISGAGVVSGPGVSSEVGESLLTSDSIEEAEVSPSGEVGVGLPESSGERVGSKLVLGVDKAKVAGEGSPGVSRDGLGELEVPSCFESGMSCGQEPEVCREPEGSGEEEEAGDEVVAEVGSGRRAGVGFLGEPARALGAGKGWPGLLLVLVVTVDPGLVVVGVPLNRPLPEGVSHVQEDS